MSEDYLSLKWGSLKSLLMRTPAVEEGFRRYDETGTHHGSAILHKDSSEQKAALCDLIDAVAAAGGRIQDEWSWKFLTADEAKHYVMGGRGPRAIDRGRGDRAERDAVAAEEGLRGGLMTPVLERLLERLQTGWQPKHDEIDMRIPQRTMARWEPWPSRHASRPHMLIAGWPVDDDGAWPQFTEHVLWIDEHLEWALCEDGFWWLE